MTYQQIFLEHNGPGPWACAFCSETVTSISSRTRYLRRDDGTVHHINHDHGNDAPENLAAAHHGCHVRHHRTGVPKSAEHRAKLSAALKGRSLPSATRTKISMALAGKPKSAATRQRMSEAQRGHHVSDQTRERLRLSHIGQVAWNKGRRASDDERMKIAAISQRRECECGMTTNPGALGRHISATGHQERRSA